MKELNFGEIEELKQELLSLGYHRFQIDNLMRKVVHTTRLEKVSAEELVNLTNTLVQYRDFAKKCCEN